MAVHPRLTFKAGTLSRFIQRYGIQANWRIIDIPNETYWIEISRPDGEALGFTGVMSGIPDVEKAFHIPAIMSYHWESAGGTPSGLARFFGIDETKSGEVYADYEEMHYDLLDLLGGFAYRELMEIYKAQDKVGEDEGEG